MSKELTSREPNELSADINVITAEINAYQRVAGEAIFEIGRRLKHVKENDLAHGEWAKWLKDDVNISHEHARRFIKVFERFEKSTPEWSLMPNAVTVLYELTSLTDEQLTQEYEFLDGTKKKPVEMSRRQIEEMKRIERERDEARKQAEAERKERERLEEENEELRNQEPKVVTEYVETEPTEPYDRTLDYPYDVQQGNDFYAMLNEVVELYKKYTHLKDGIDELRSIARHDEDMQTKYRKASDFWRMLESVFNNDNEVEIVDASYVEVN